MPRILVGMKYRKIEANNDPYRGSSIVRNIGRIITSAKRIIGIEKNAAPIKKSAKVLGLGLRVESRPPTR